MSQRSSEFVYVNEKMFDKAIEKIPVAVEKLQKAGLDLKSATTVSVQLWQDSICVVASPTDPLMAMTASAAYMKAETPQPDRDDNERRKDLGLSVYVRTPRPDVDGAWEKYYLLPGDWRAELAECGSVVEFRIPNTVTAENVGLYVDVSEELLLRMRRTLASAAS